MCSPARCARCGKTTWRGCGRHVDEVLATVPPHQRCTCAPATPARSGGGFGSLFRRKR